MFTNKKKIATVLFICLTHLSFCIHTMAQTPEKMSYQAVIRDGSNTLVVNQQVGMQISILQGSANGAAVFIETHNAPTNANGLVSIEVGGGTAVLGSINGVNWANGPYFIKTETDPAGGSNYTITGTSQLLSVPYAMYAAASGSSIPGPQGPAGATGATGPQGPAGNDGAIGPQGPAGATGPQGLTGATGAQGPIGNTGANGPQGPQGPAGATGPQGPAGAQGAQGTGVTILGSFTSVGQLPVTGAAGDSYLVNGDLYVWSTNTLSWSNVGNIQGPAGVAGPQGTQGPTGLTGATGPAGATGPQGAQGSQGLTGPQGPIGLTGSQGAAGTNGTNGAVGAQGPQGPIGLTGATGAAGTNGVNGAVGATGPQGAAGANGINGSNGADGKTVLNGTSNPLAVIGNNGDFYINTTTNTIFGPKAAGTWPATGVSLVGPQGATGATGPQGATGLTGATGAAGTNGINGAVGATGPQGPIGLTGATGAAGTNGINGAVGAQGPIGLTGAAGKTVLNGTTNPTAIIGNNGDFYINTTTNTIFGPKAAGIWPINGVSLVGPQGATGPAGVAGPQGVIGLTGPAGPQGATGPAGANGSNGTNGADGKTVLNGISNPTALIGSNGDFYINTTTNSIFGPKAAGTWPINGVSLVGPQGATGPAGASGAQGPAGIAGPQGAIGLTGPTGPQGATGPAGANGINGTNGANGADGKTVLNGTSNPTALIGSNGDFYINTITNTIFGPKASGAWPATGVSLVGPQGATGATGPQGSIGLTGATGAAGTNGLNGAVGATGPIGPIGLTGATGAAGTNGINGADGAQGPIGLTGAAGKTVLNGTTNPTAVIGNNGDFYINTATNTIFGPKAAGTWPATGVSLVGPQGATGATGPVGANGTNGQNALVKTTTEAAGSNCANGGVKLEYGLDVNSNGLLEVSEVNAALTKYICNGTNSSQSLFLGNSVSLSGANVASATAGTFNVSGLSYLAIKGSGANQSVTISITDLAGNPLNVTYDYFNNAGWQQCGGCCGVYYHSTDMGVSQASSFALGSAVGGCATGTGYYYKVFPPANVAQFIINYSIGSVSNSFSITPINH